MLILIDATTITVTHRNTGEDTIDPARTYWRSNNKEPGRWPGPSH